MVHPTQHGKNRPSAKPQIPASSPGDEPVEMVPLDASPQDATWRDRTERKIASDNAEEKADALLDEASDLSFPASDPIAASPTRIERKAGDSTPRK